MDMGCLLIKEAMFANCILFATFCSMSALVRKRKTWRYSARKVMEFGLLMADIPVYVSCKFEMYIFKIALVISENVCIAFLYVLSIFMTQNCFKIYFLLTLNYLSQKLCVGRFIISARRKGFKQRIFNIFFVNFKIHEF